MNRRFSVGLAACSLVIGATAAFRSTSVATIVLREMRRRGRERGVAPGGSSALRAVCATAVWSAAAEVANALVGRCRVRRRAPTVLGAAIVGTLAAAGFVWSRRGSPALGGAFGLAGSLVGASVRSRFLRWSSGRAERSRAVARTAPRDLARRGDILLFSGGKGFNWMIQVFGRTPYFHAAIYCGDDEIVEEQPKGATRRTLRSDYGSHCIAVLPSPGGPEAGERALDWALSQIGAPFDPLDFYVVFLPHVFTHLNLNYAPRGRYTCAEFVAAAYRHAGVALVPGVELSNIEPADFAKLLPCGAAPANWFGGKKCG